MPRSATTSDVPTSPSPSLMSGPGRRAGALRAVLADGERQRRGASSHDPGRPISRPANASSRPPTDRRRPSTSSVAAASPNAAATARRKRSNTRRATFFRSAPRSSDRWNATFTAAEDCFCLLLAAEEVRPLATAESAFREFLAARRARPRVCRDSAAAANASRTSPSSRWKAARLAATQASGRRGRRDSAAGGPAMMNDRACRIGARPRRRGPRRRDPHPARRPRPRDAARRRADDAGARRHVDAGADDERRRHGATMPSWRCRATASAICR